MKEILRLICIISCIYSWHVSLLADEAPFEQEQEHEQIYKIEMVIFQRTDLSALTEESWLSYPPLPSFENAEDMSVLDLLPEDDLTLTGEANDIDSSSAYSVLLHQGWFQPILKPNKASSIHIYAQPLGDSKKPWLNSRSYINDLLFNRWRINGILTISQLNYFNVNADIILTIPFNELNKFQNLGQTIAPDRSVLNFHMQQSRRVRNDQLYYFDHPLFGILIEISEYEPDKDRTNVQGSSPANAT